MKVIRDRICDAVHKCLQWEDGEIAGIDMLKLEQHIDGILAQLIKLLEEIDELMTYLEDTAHGEEGKRITEMRYKILTELSNSHKHGVSGKQPYYQLCPKCAGEGQVHNIGTTSSLFRICPVCNGSRTLYVDPSMVACASGGEATVAERGHKFTCRVCGEHEKEWSRKNDDWYCKTCGYICNPH